ncbi:MAG: hypothetical protein PHR53_06315 [Bacteroidales bacterium]|nr:hypothetical protein [Bacteroidales bacterium]
MKKSLIILSFIGIMLIPMKGFSQIEITVGPSFPVGSFLDEVESFQTDSIYHFTDGNYLSGARIGLDVGLKYRFKIHKKWQAFVGANLIWNPVKKSFQEEIENNISLFTEDYKVRSGQYFQIPVMAGVNYTYNPSDEFGIFVDAGCGVNIVQRSPFEVNRTLKNNLLQTKAYDVNIKSTYKTLYNFAFQAGIGAVVKNRYMIAVHYYGLGNMRSEGTTKIDGLDKIANDLNENILQTFPFLAGTNENPDKWDKSVDFKSDTKRFSQAISFTFGIRFGQCHQEKKPKAVTAKEKETSKKVKNSKKQKE